MVLVQPEQHDDHFFHRTWTTRCGQPPMSGGARATTTQGVTRYQAAVTEVVKGALQMATPALVVPPLPGTRRTW